MGCATSEKKITLLAPLLPIRRRRRPLQVLDCNETNFLVFVFRFRPILRSSYGSDGIDWIAARAAACSSPTGPCPPADRRRAGHLAPRDPVAGSGYSGRPHWPASSFFQRRRRCCCFLARGSLTTSHSVTSSTSASPALCKY